MKTIQVSLFYEPGTSHIQSVEMIAEKAVKSGAISSMPEIEVRQSEIIKSFWSLIFTVKEQDWSFWVGFWQGMVFCATNRSITVGVD